MMLKNQGHTGKSQSGIQKAGGKSSDFSGSVWSISPEAATVTVPRSEGLRAAAHYQFLGFQTKAGPSLASVLIAKHQSLSPRQSCVPRCSTPRSGEAASRS